jgi:hypothetical protein
MRPSEPPIQVKKHYHKETEKKHYAKLKKEFGRYKKLAHGYGLQSILALRNYPELKDVNIQFEFDKWGKPLSAKPFIYTLFNEPSARKYKILISTDAKPPVDEILLRELDFNLQVGQFSHEIGHIFDYIHKSSLEVIGTGAGYIIDKFKTRLESKVDKIAVEHGFGYQLIEFARLMEKMAEKYPAEKYYAEYFDYYLTAGEIRELMDKLPLYNQS